MEILARENLVRGKAAPTAISKTFSPLVRRIWNLVSLVRTLLSDPSSKVKLADLGVGGGK